MNDIKWADPPVDGRRVRTGGEPGVRQRFVATLKEHPGRWAQFRPDTPNWASNASGLKKAFPGVEVVSRVRDDGKYDIYARWVGNGNGDTAS